MWQLYNLVREGDDVTATTFRKVARDVGLGAESEKVKLTLTVKVSLRRQTGRFRQRGSTDRRRQLSWCNVTETTTALLAMVKQSNTMVDRPRRF